MTNLFEDDLLDKETKDLIKSDSKQAAKLRTKRIYFTMLGTMFYFIASVYVINDINQILGGFMLVIPTLIAISYMLKTYQETEELFEYRRRTLTAQIEKLENLKKED